jgi:hypothetical protein
MTRPATLRDLDQAGDAVRRETDALYDAISGVHRSAVSALARRVDSIADGLRDLADSMDVRPPRRVLVIEDDAQVAAGVAALCYQAGLAAVVAPTAAAGLYLLCQRAPWAGVVADSVGDEALAIARERKIPALSYSSEPAEGGVAKPGLDELRSWLEERAR